ncbi:hypothetical protein CEXT_665291 [Caerostris extrusa]|uniref:Uncharacterized protein n=1 Tax=Caerostris extrusa TaxID=172846 RepID=A0AAV4RR23_CAEEX|nr:hypothetical protein CEXT_665291 [Caerostris extrusa]
MTSYSLFSCTPRFYLGGRNVLFDVLAAFLHPQEIVGGDALHGDGLYAVAQLLKGLQLPLQLSAVFVFPLPRRVRLVFRCWTPGTWKSAVRNMGELSTRGPRPT